MTSSRLQRPCDCRFFSRGLGMSAYMSAYRSQCHSSTLQECYPCGAAHLGAPAPPKDIHYPKTKGDRSPQWPGINFLHCASGQLQSGSHPQAVGISVFLPDGEAIFATQCNILVVYWIVAGVGHHLMITDCCSATEGQSSGPIHESFSKK